MTLNTGGAFTGRGAARPHHFIAALLSRKARRPVKIRAYSDEEFLMGRAGGRNDVPLPLRRLRGTGGCGSSRRT